MFYPKTVQAKELFGEKRKRFYFLNSILVDIVRKSNPSKSEKPQKRKNRLNTQQA